MNFHIMLTYWQLSSVEKQYLSILGWVRQHFAGTCGVSHYYEQTPKPGMDTRINECLLQPLVRSDSVDRGTSAESTFRNIVASFDLHGAPRRTLQNKLAVRAWRKYSWP